MKNKIHVTLVTFFALAFFTCQDAPPKTPAETRPAEEVAAPVIRKTNVVKKAENFTTGTFTEIEQGDYFYLHIKGADGEDQSFLILESYVGDNQLNFENWETFVGKQIRVGWKEIDQMIPEDGGAVRKIKQVVGLEIGG